MTTETINPKQVLDPIMCDPMRVKLFFIICTLAADALCASGQEQFITPKTHYPVPLDYGDKNELPSGVPRLIDTNGNVIYVDMNFTTPMYHEAALKLLLQEANQIALDLRLPEELPITESNLTRSFIGPFGYNLERKCIGNISTKHYCYYVSVGNRFSYLDRLDEDIDYEAYSTSYTWPISQIDTNLAYLQATQWLAAAHMDVIGINRDCQRFVVPDHAYTHAPPGEFVPLYNVYWKSTNGKRDTVASVMFLLPTKTLISLRVEDPKYILRKPLVFSNLEALFPGVAPIVTITNYPPKSIEVSR